ncbi:MAG: histidine kinase N-terminal 7TM domain-containing protein, partial [Dehalococcoidia bacterium]
MRTPLAVYLLAMALWSFCSFMAHLDSPLLSTTAWLRIMSVGLTFAPWGMLYFVTAFLGTTKRHRLLLGSTFVVSLAVAFTALVSGLIVAQGQVVSGRLEYGFGPLFPVAASLLYAIYVISLA